MLIFDAHLDLAMNALEWNRDLTRSIDEIRQREQGMTDKPDRGRGTVCLSEMQRQLAWYRAMEEAGQMTQIKDAEGLKWHLKLWAETPAASSSSSSSFSSSIEKGPGNEDENEDENEDDQKRKLPIGYILNL